jgi:hypothetical protein
MNTLKKLFSVVGLWLAMSVALFTLRWCRTSELNPPAVFDGAKKKWSSGYQCHLRKLELAACCRLVPPQSKSSK